MKLLQFAAVATAMFSSFLATASAACPSGYDRHPTEGMTIEQYRALQARFPGGIMACLDQLCGNLRGDQVSAGNFWLILGSGRQFDYCTPATAPYTPDRRYDSAGMTPFARAIVGAVTAGQNSTGSPQQSTMGQSYTDSVAEDQGRREREFIQLQRQQQQMQRTNPPQR